MIVDYPADVNGVLGANLQTQLYKYLPSVGHSPYTAGFTALPPSINIIYIWYETVLNYNDSYFLRLEYSVVTRR